MRPLPSKPLSPRSILVVRLSALGDLIQVLPALDAVSARFPDASIDAVTESLSSGILEGHPALRRVIRLPRSEMKDCWRQPQRRAMTWTLIDQFCRELRSERYDLLIDWQSNYRSAIVRGLARADMVLGIHPDDGGELPRWWPGYRPATAAGYVHRSERALHVVRSLGWHGEAPTGRLGAVDDSLEDVDLDPVDAMGAPVLLHPFVSDFGRFKEWPAHRWIELARSLSGQGLPVWISGAPEDRNAVATMVEASGTCAVAAPFTSDLKQLAALLGCCRAVVAADTGVLHLAAIRGVPSIGLYGAKDPAVYAPRNRWTRVVRSAVSCSPCTLRHCDHSFCMAAITVDHVEASLRELLDAEATPH